MTDRDPRAKSPVGRLLSMGKLAEARKLILRIAKGTNGDGPAISHNALGERLGVHRQSLWRYFKRLDGVKDEVEAVYAQALLDTAPSEVSDRA